MGKSQLDSFKKKGLNIRTSTKNGVETKSVECSYGIKTEDGQRFTAILNRMESSDGNQGIISFIIRDNVSLAPQGTLRSISHWNVFQWGLFLLSLIMIFRMNQFQQHLYKNFLHLIVLCIQQHSLGFPLDKIHSMNHNNQYNYLLLLLLLSFCPFCHLNSPDVCNIF